MWASVIAVAGTLLGGVVTGLLQERAGRAARREARADQRRDDQLRAVAELVAALGDHRRALWFREDLRLAGADAEALAAARTASHATRSAVTAPLVSVSVLAPPLAGSAREASMATFAVRAAADRDALAALRQSAIAATDRFVAAAGGHLGRGL
ncbi:protein kilB [Streptomyces hainanensis]|uniref:Protein kilB n=2 Tax=Streptomyces hainanensis TaxID=402648 RepID=A0A4R4TPH7_9ACTN|nr:protein kilB [Streptomyces hainanensis]